MGIWRFPLLFFLLPARIMEIDISNNPVTISMHHVNGAYFHNFLVHDEKNMGKESNNISLSLDFATYSKVTEQEGQSVFHLYFDNETDFRTFAVDMQETLRVVEEKIKEIEDNITRELDMN
jgi:hypothetical protein